MTDQVIEIAGVGVHAFGRFPNESLKDLARVAIIRALVDAGIGVKELDAVYSSNALAGALQGQDQIRGQTVLRECGIEGIPVTNVENACASGSTALREAVIAIRAGEADTVLAVGFEKMFVGDRDKSLSALESAADQDVVAGLGLRFTAVYAMRLRRLLEAGALTERHLVDSTVKSHYNGSLNPFAQFQKTFTADEVRASRVIADPLTLLMCSSICDGAAAVVVSRRRLGPQARPRVRIRGTASGSGFTRSDNAAPSLTAGCARRAYEAAGVGPDDIDVAEIHDAMAPGELLYYEELGFCAPGHAGELLDSGATGIKGSIAVNTSGGLTSRGHAIGATGLAQAAELTWQLRGEGGARQVQRPRLALAHNSGGWLEGESAACNIHILERTDPWT